MNVLQHSVQEGLGKKNISVCMTLPTRRGVMKSESPLFDPLLPFSEYTGWYFDRSVCGRSHGLTNPTLATFFIAWSDNQLPFIKRALPFWWPRKCNMATWGVYGLLQRVTGFQKHVLSLYCLKWGALFLSRLLCEHAPQRMHRGSLCMYLLACL